MQPSIQAAIRNISIWCKLTATYCDRVPIDAVKIHRKFGLIINTHKKDNGNRWKYERYYCLVIYR